LKGLGKNILKLIAISREADRGWRTKVYVFKTPPPPSFRKRHDMTTKRVKGEVR